MGSYLNRKHEKRDWYFRIIRGTGITVCAAALALLIYLLNIIMKHGLDITLLAFLFVPFLTFAVGCLFVSLSRVGDERTGTDLMVMEEELEPVLKKVAILSDTHGLLRPEVAEIAKNCDYIIHAGDLGSGEVLGELRKLAPLYVVKGNNDRGIWTDSLEEILRITICGMRVLVVHDRKNLTSGPGDADLVIFGHSHKYCCQQEDGVLWLNPGSCGKRRFRLPVTMAVMEIGEHSFRIRQHILEETGEPV